MRLSLTLVVFIVLGLLTLPAAMAQDTGTLQGLVVDAETGDPMIGVNVIVQGTTLGAACDLDGNFRISNVPVGTHTIVATMIGYSRVTIHGVIVDGEAFETLNFKMHAEALEIGEVVIEAKRIDNTEAALLSLQRSAPSVADGISAEQIRKSPDSDAADAVKRITGVTVMGDKYVFVRGMGERYNNTRLNGATIASPEPLKRVVPFDIIPANLLNNIVVSKTFTPDQPGDFAGGSVQLTTKDFPEKLTFQASAGSSYNDQASLKEFYGYRGGNRDWLAMDDGARVIPDEIRGATESPQWQTDAALQKTLGKVFSNVWEPRAAWAPLDGSRSLSVGNQLQLLEMPLGYLVSLNYNESYSSRHEKQYNYYARSDTATGITSVNQYQDLDVTRSRYAVNWGGILDLNLKLSPRNKIGFKSLYMRSADDEARRTEGITKEERLYRNYRLTWTERSLLTAQLKGAHDLPQVGDSRLDWGVVVSYATYLQPDRRDVHFTRPNDDEPWQWLINSDNGFRRFGDMEDNVLEGMADWTTPMPLAGNPSSKLKLGGLIRSMRRDFETRKFYYSYVDDPDRTNPDWSLPPELLLSPGMIDSFWVLREITRTLDSYEAEMNVTAGYVMTDYALGGRWRVVGGVRIEHTDQNYETYPYPGSPVDTSASGGPKHTDVLPAMNVIYKVNEQINLRAAASMTIANPDYAEIVPTEDSDYFEGAVKYGNPNLKHTKIVNLDLRSEYYPSLGENISIGIFYKSLKDPIEQVLIASGATERLQPRNLVDAYNIGAEFEFRKSLECLAPRTGGWIRYFSALGNVTLISSNVILKDDPYDPRNPASGLLTNDSRPLMGQSPYVINAALSFDQPAWGSSVRLLFNTFGKRISHVGGYGLPDTYEYPFHRMDVVYNQTLGGHWSAKLNATNILNTNVEFKTGDEPFLHYKTGRNFSLGLSYVI